MECIFKYTLKCCCMKKRETYDEFMQFIKMILAATREVIVSSSTMFDLMCLYEICSEFPAKAGCCL